MNLTEKVKNYYGKQLKDIRCRLEYLADGQNPHTLFITCSDSRIVPNLITDALPGELFVVRNIANIVPDYELRHIFCETYSAVEYAVTILNVKNIVICGHSDCGGCKVLRNEYKAMDESPLKKWLSQSEKVLKNYGNLSPEVVERMNVVYQVEKINNYPFVSEKLKSKTINLYGWYFSIKTGKIYNYNFTNRKFEEI